MKSTYQIGTQIFGLIFWRKVSPEKFGKKVAPLLLSAGQLDTIQPAELLPIFQHDFILRDGNTLYRAIPQYN